MRRVQLIDLMSVAAVICVGLALGLFWIAAHFTDQSNKLEPALIGAYATAASFLVATAGWLTTNAISVRADMREKTSEFLARRQHDEKILDALKAVGDFGRDNPDLINPPGQADLGELELYLDSEPGESFRNSLRLTLNLFEEMAIFIRRNGTDEAILRDFYVGTLYRLHDIYAPLKPIILGVRPDGRWARPEMYENLDWLYRRWRQFYRDNYLYD